MTEIIKGASGQNRYLIMTEQDARQLMNGVPNLKFYRCIQLGEFSSVLGSLPITAKIELCHRLRMVGSNYDGFLSHQFKAGTVQVFCSGASHYTASKNLLAENYESSFFLVPAISGLEYSGVQYHKLAANQAETVQYLQRLNLDETKTKQLVLNFYNNTGNMFKSGAPIYSSTKDYENHLATLLVDGNAIIIEKVKSLFIPQEEVVSNAVGVSALRPNQVEEPVEEEPIEEESEEILEKLDFYFSY